MYMFLYFSEFVCKFSKDKQVAKFNLQKILDRCKIRWFFMYLKFINTAAKYCEILNNFLN